jgi:CheY-like chemotaxis protein
VSFLVLLDHLGVTLTAFVPYAPFVDRGRVLIVDDEPLIGTTLKVLLADHDVVVATTGIEAQRLLQNDGDFDVILCDLMMPGISGIDLHAWALARNPALARRMVFMTGGAFTERARKFLVEVSNPRLDKPFDPPELVRSIEQWIARRRRPSGERPQPAGR